MSKFDLNHVSQQYFDILKELGNIGAGKQRQLWHRCLAQGGYEGSAGQTSEISGGWRGPWVARNRSWQVFICW